MPEWWIQRRAWEDGGEGKETIRGNLVLGAWTLSFKEEPTTVWFEPGLMKPV